MSHGEPLDPAIPSLCLGTSLCRRQDRSVFVQQPSPKRAKIAAVNTYCDDECDSDDAAARSLYDRLLQYTDIPLSEYRPDSHHLAANMHYPGLRAIHKDPWIFVVSNLLTRYECQQLIIKASMHMTESARDAGRGATHRNSRDCRIARGETMALQSKYSALLNVPIENLEAVKVTRYDHGQLFTNHVDPIADTAAFENRVATLFVYLNTVDNGGETRFLSLPSQRQLEYTVGEKVCCLLNGEGDYPGQITQLNADGTVDVEFDDGDFQPGTPRSELRAYETLSVKPLQGMGVLFFPAFLPSSPFARQFVKQLDRYLVHESCPAIDQKFIHQQWVWPNRAQSHFEGLVTNGVCL
ncbi:unnamed protein product [Polarella glacialis]|uniref:Prolyl 4-hydroxylase alpha subunit domain-containing protein n=1 Tax=Polarella glacialis TaxID=89957 RepID=A0A813KWS7_POLGL|nr:unnamed protein product [Polarella glacialis]CAE8714631.1 unnamed protein product [Polarella glacialis]